MTRPIDIRADHLRIVQDVLHRLLPAGVKVWVFGSRASWMTKDSSDLDLALEGDIEIPPRILSALEAAFDDSDLPFAVDIVDVKRISERFKQIVAQQRLPFPKSDHQSSTQERRHSGGEWLDGTLAGACSAIDYGLTASASNQPGGLRFLRITDIVSGQVAPEDTTEQCAIAHILSTLDDKLELNRRMNATLEAMARALFRSWFVDFDPVRAKMEGRDTGLPKDIADLFPDRLVDSELGEIPEGWRVGHVEDGFEVIMGQSPPGHTCNDTGDGLPFFQGRSDFGFRYPKNRKFCTAPNRIAQPWDTIVSVRAPVGDINMAWERCCIGRGVAALRPRSGAVSFGYCTAQALQPHMREYEHTGRVFGAISRTQLAGLPSQQPAADVIRAFEHLVQPWDQAIRLRTAQGDTLTVLRDTLLPRLVSGALRVRIPGRGRSGKATAS